MLMNDAIWLQYRSSTMNRNACFDVFKFKFLATRCDKQ